MCFVHPGGRGAADDDDNDDHVDDDEDEDDDDDERGDGIRLDELGVGSTAATMVPPTGSSHFLSPFDSLNQYSRLCVVE